MTREEYIEKLRKLKEDIEKQTEAAITIQKIYRGLLAQRMYKLMKERDSHLVYRKNVKIVNDLVNFRINRVPSLNKYYVIASSYYRNIKTNKLFIPEKLVKSVKGMPDLMNYVKYNMYIDSLSTIID